ncbi:MAG: hypothetical protein ACI9GW_000800 [Halieaceae bacterium]|jgi:uncharacterized protein YbgA (DUF1722 family)/uncharacterized protein YbbK (DUF523 family)
MTIDTDEVSVESDQGVKIPVGISSCLLGERVRFDSGHKNNSYITGTLSNYFSLRAFCPEVSIGLGIPRQPIRLVKDSKEGNVRCIGTKNADLDVTSRLTESAQQQFGWISELSGYIFKKDSPSCGMERVKVYFKDMPERTGVGIYTREILREFPDLPTEEEGRLGDVHLRENFVGRVFLYHRWREMLANNPGRSEFVDFHSRHKLIYMSHSQSKARELGQLVAGIAEMDLEEYARCYIRAVSKLTSEPASRKNHTNVLMHVQGYLKRDLDADDRQGLKETIEDYRVGYLPLIVPITLLRHHFRRCPSEYIDRSWYMQPHPRELMLRNTL